MTKEFFKYHIFFCLNSRNTEDKRGCCMSKGAEALFEYLKEQVKSHHLKKTRVNRAGCLDQCAYGPTVVVYPEGIWYSLKSKVDIDQVVQHHLMEGKPVEHLMIKKN
jgi:(2Fe-2S) ferredoxin